MKTAIVITLICITYVSAAGIFDANDRKGKNAALVAVAAIFALAIIAVAG